MKIEGTKNYIITKFLELEDKLYEVEIKEKRSQRSIEQNKLMWKLINLIAKETAHSDMEVYCAVLEKANVLSDYIITATLEEQELRKSFRAVRFIHKSIINGKEFNVYKVYLGSSKMNVKEMTELLEIVFQLCAELKIPTLEG